ncbi:dihydrouridine synthase [Plectosphaerella cucumerina]|uniref:tRNA-dihydrouridine(16/17) synthase [NAD(P)(+)] n=1 Tax=Plectosphaerella cucumerina TaxID=40658 RepID=A0A8K0TFG6_9PEZI|nr:dihydrouridine synthase [Plectosphaerella cucumerina]
MATPEPPRAADDVNPGPGKAKLHGRAFYESIGSPKYIVAPMVNQSEFAWRMLTRSFLAPEERKKVLAYSPMYHSRHFSENEGYRSINFQPTRPAPADAPDQTPQLWLDGNPAMDRPLFVQFCANDPEALLGAAKKAAPYCDAVDLNLGCPQGIARKGHYGAFLQEDQDLIFRLINTLHRELDVPVTAKIRILDTREATLAYARNVLRAGASILTVHGRRREQKGHLTGVADWSTIRWLREQLPPETVMFANGNILQRGDLEACLEATGADGVMSAEGNLSDPTLFAEPPAPGNEGREYWRGRDGLGGFRVDAVVRRYLDILHRYAAGTEPPERRPLFVPGDDESWLKAEAKDEDGQPARKKQRRDEGPKTKEAKKAAAKDAKRGKRSGGPNYNGMQPHMFHLLRHFVARHTDVRDVLARSRSGDLEAYEEVLALMERRVAEGLLEYERTGVWEEPVKAGKAEAKEGEDDDPESSAATVRKCRRPWWVVQPIVRPLPAEAMAKGAVALSKKDLQKRAEEEAGSGTLTPGQAVQEQVLATDDKLLAG